MPSSVKSHYHRWRVPSIHRRMGRHRPPAWLVILLLPILVPLGLALLVVALICKAIAGVIRWLTQKHR